MDDRDRRSAMVMDAVVAAIDDRGPIGFDVFMELVLYGAGGYYERPPVGPRGDFVTSPHVHPIFGQLLAGAIRELFDGFPSATGLQLIEVGAGDGTLLRQLLPELEDLPVHPIAVERSPGARDLLRELDGVDVIERLDQAPEGVGVVLAHELLDNLPFRRFRATEEGPRGVSIGHDGGRLVEVLLPPSGPPPAIDREGVVPVGARELAVQALAVAHPRYLLAIDYGSDSSAEAEVHGYRDHQVVGDVLHAPGLVDITAGVPFGDLREHLLASGLEARPTISQRAALRFLGFEAWIASALERQGDLLNTGRGIEAVRTWEERGRAELLVEPAGLGRFRWMLANASGLPEPPWFSRAREPS